jgi:hypothetical protein
MKEEESNTTTTQQLNNGFAAPLGGFSDAGTLADLDFRIETLARRISQEAVTLSITEVSSSKNITMDDTIPKSHENFNESIEEMEERLSYMPVGSPGYVKLSEKINHYSGSSEYSESSERRSPENHQIPESIQVSERHSESNQLPESEHSDFQTNNFQNQESVFQTQLVSQSFQSQNAGAESTLFHNNSLEKEHSHESIDPMMEISIQEQLKREDCDSLGSASCVSMTSSDNEAEYSPLAPSTMNLTQIGATFKSVGSEVEIMRESVLDEEEEEEEENEEIRNVESKNFDTFEQEDGDDGLESYELIGKR